MSFPEFVDPNTAKAAKIADMRAEFERLSQQTPRDAIAERAFIESKIALIRRDSHLSAAQKEEAVEELQRGIPPC